MLHRVSLVARTVWLEFLRRKDFYVVLILVGLCVMGIAVVRIIGIENPATARFLMSLGLLVSYSLAAVLTAATAARQLPSEFENRTLHPLLAQPISRAEVILGKSLAVLTVACSSLLLFLLLSWVAVPKLPGQRLLVFVQVVALRMAAISLLGIFATALSLFMPAVISVFVSLTVFFAAPLIINLSGRLVGSLWQLAGKVTERALAIVPDFSVFEHSQRYVEGGPPISLAATIAAFAYAVAFAAFFTFVSVVSFNRKSL